MKSINLIVRQWNGLLGYELEPTPNPDEYPPDLLADLHTAGLAMYITRYVSTKVKRRPSHTPFTNTLTYYRNPNAPNEPLFLIVDNKNTKQPPIAYEIRLIFHL